jgi:hypothetical protein
VPHRADEPVQNVVEELCHNLARSSGVRRRPDGLNPPEIDRSETLSPQVLRTRSRLLLSS